MIQRMSISDTKPSFRKARADLSPSTSLIMHKKQVAPVEHFPKSMDVREGHNREGRSRIINKRRRQKLREESPSRAIIMIIIIDERNSREHAPHQK